MKKLIGTIDCTPKIKAYWKCEVTEFTGSVKILNIQKGNGSAQNFLNLGYKYASITYCEAYVNEGEYLSLTFIDNNNF